MRSTGVTRLGFDWAKAVQGMARRHCLISNASGLQATPPDGILGQTARLRKDRVTPVAPHLAAESG